MSRPTFEPTTWLLLEHVRTALQLVTVERGYYTDLGAGVVALEAAQLPADDALHTLIMATDSPVNDDTSTRTHTRSDMEILIEASVPFADGEDAQLQAHRARADLLRALIPLRKDIKNRPRGVNSFSITGSTIGVPDDGASVVIVQVTARAGLTESISPATP